jgi:putative ABC transport system permease protein
VVAVTTLRVSVARIGDASLQIIGIEPESYPVLGGLSFTAGDPETAYSALAHGHSLISNGVFAAQAGLEVGQDVTLQTPAGLRTYRVVAIGSDYLSAKIATVFVSHQDLARDFDEHNDILLLINRAPDADPATVKAALEAVIADYPAFTLLETAAWKEELIASTSFARMSLFYALMTAAGALSLIALVNTLGINVLERTREIGMLRAVGATRRQVQRLIVAEGLLLSIAGTGFGLLAGLWLGYLLVGALNAGGLNLPYFFPWTGVLLAVGVGLLFGVAGALIPASQAARLDIITALRYE